jgi:hypothetical protein
MSRVSPTLEGFRAAFRRPAFTLAEITWRWAAGGSGIALLLLGVVEFLKTLPVTNGELLLLRSHQPYLVALAIRHILAGSCERIVFSAVLVLFLLGILWVVAASLGRLVTVNALLDYVRQRLARATWAAGLTEDEGTGIARTVTSRNPVYALIRLNGLRASLTLVAIIALIGAAILGELASSDRHPRPGLTLLLFVPLAAIVWLVWSWFNWLLSLSAMFVVRDRENAMVAIREAVALCRRRRAAILAVSSWTGFAHLVVFVGASTLALIPLGLLGLLAWRAMALMAVVGTLAYFAFADWLYMARLAGYIYIAETPDALLVAPPAVIVPPSDAPRVPWEPPAETRIDPEELILSDIPGLRSDT